MRPVASLSWWDGESRVRRFRYGCTVTVELRMADHVGGAP